MMLRRALPILLLSISGVEAAFTCDPWPHEDIYGCADNGQDWRLLTNSASTQEDCMSRCEAVAETGDSACCFFSRALGCNIKVGANRSEDASDSAFATECKLQTNLFRLEIHGTVFDEYSGS